MSVTDYTKIKEICDALGSINVTLDKDELVQTCLGGLAQRYGPISDSDLHPEEAIVFLRVAIDAGGPRKPREWVEDHSIGQSDAVHGGGLALWAWGPRWISTQCWRQTRARKKAQRWCR